MQTVHMKCEALFSWQTIHMNKALFSLKDKAKYLQMLPATILNGALII